MAVRSSADKSISTRFWVMRGYFPEKPAHCRPAQPNGPSRPAPRCQPHPPVGAFRNTARHSLTRRSADRSPPHQLRAQASEPCVQPPGACTQRFHPRAQRFELCAQASDPCAQARNAQAQGSKPWTAKVPGLRARFKPSRATRKPSRPVLELLRAPLRMLPLQGCGLCVQGFQGCTQGAEPCVQGSRGCAQGMEACGRRFLAGGGSADPGRAAMGLDVEVGWAGATAIAAATHSKVHSDPGFAPFPVPIDSSGDAGELIDSCQHRGRNALELPIGNLLPVTLQLGDMHFQIVRGNHAKDLACLFIIGRRP